MEPSEITFFREQRSVRVRGDGTSDWGLSLTTDEEREVRRKRVKAIELM